MGILGEILLLYTSDLGKIRVSWSNMVYSISISYPWASCLAAMVTQPGLVWSAILTKQVKQDL